MLDYIECCKRYEFAKKKCDSMGVLYLDDQDIVVCNYVMKNLSYVDLNTIYSGNKVSLDYLIDKSINEMELFGDDIVNSVLDLVKVVPINKKYTDIVEYSASISYDINNSEVSHKGLISSYNIPINIYEYSVYPFSHEHFHALKETNYLEWKNSNRFGEVISLFYELLASDSDDFLRKQILKARMHSLFYNGCEYSITDELIQENNNSSDLGLYLFVRSKIGSYLNSFYYAVVLYNMYKVNPKKILDMISKVLKHEITTLEMLEQLNIYGDIRGDVFEKETVNIRKRIK